MKNRKMLGNIILLFTAMIWGTAFVYQRVGMDYIEPITFSAVRMYLAAGALAIVAAVMDKIRSKNGTAAKDNLSPEEYSNYKKNTLKGGIFCGLCLSGGTIFQQIGVVTTSAGKSGFITALYMLLVPVISVIFLRKKIGWLAWVGVAVGTVGLYLLSITGEFTVARGDSLLMVCALFFSLHILCCDHFGSGADTVRVSMLQFLTTAVVCTVLCLLLETPTTEKILSAWFPIIFCGLLSGALGYTLQMVGQKFSEPTVASLLMSLESVFAAISGWLILKERMSSREILGCVIMFAAIVLVQIPLPGKRGTEK